MGTMKKIINTCGIVCGTLEMIEVISLNGAVVFLINNLTGK